MYVSFEDGMIYEIDYVCTCEHCKKRGSPEIFFKTLNGFYADAIPVNDLHSVVDFSESLPTVVNSTVSFFKREVYKQKRNNEFLQTVINHYLNNERNLL